MSKKRLLSLAAVGLMSMWALARPGGVRAQEAPKVQIPQPGVPQIMTMEGRYVRVAYNNEGYVILGYRIVNLSVGEEWMLPEEDKLLEKNFGDIKKQVDEAFKKKG